MPKMRKKLIKKSNHHKSLTFTTTRIEIEREQSENKSTPNCDIDEEQVIFKCVFFATDPEK